MRFGLRFRNICREPWNRNQDCRESSAGLGATWFRGLTLELAKSRARARWRIPRAISHGPSCAPLYGTGVATLGWGACCHHSSYGPARLDRYCGQVPELVMWTQVGGQVR